MGQKHDYGELMWTEMTSLGELLHELPDAEFEQPSLCAGWAVRDVVGHMIFGHTTPFAALTKDLIRGRFNVEKVSFVASQRRVADLSADEIRAEWDRLVDNRIRIGITRVIRSVEGFVDHTIHQQDIRRPLDRPRTIPEPRLRAALDGVVGLSGPFFAPKKSIKGLRLEAADIDWSSGDGPALRGPSEAVLMATAGRTAALADVSGEGVEVLAGRL